jgi:hypothetical protein
VADVAQSPADQGWAEFIEPIGRLVKRQLCSDGKVV